MKKLIRKTVCPGVRWLGKDSYQLSRPVKGSKPEYKTVQNENHSIKELKAERSKFVEEGRCVKANPLGQAIKNASFDDMWNEIEGALKAKGCTRKTIGGYKKRYYRLFSGFPQAVGLIINRPGELTEAYLNRYVSWYVNGYEAKVEIKQNPASEVNNIKIILGWLKRLGFLDRDTYDSIKKFSDLQDNEDDYYPNVSNADLKRLFDYMEKDDPCYCDFFKFLLLTGRRPMETARIVKEVVEWK